MGSLFTQILYRPLLNAVVFLYTALPWHDFGFAIVILTVLVRLALSPLSVRAIRSGRALAALQPKVEEIKQKYKGNQAAQTEATLALYKEQKISPLGGCLPLLIQFPILIALYRVFLAGAKPESLGLLYSFIPHPAAISVQSFGVLNLAQRSIVLSLAAGLAQFIYAKLNAMQQPAGGGQMAALNNQMLYFFPVIIIIISWSQPSGLALYWVAATLFSIGEQLYVRATT